MPQPRILLVNATAVDAVPAGALSARRGADARQLAAASWLLRRKSDGRFLATLHARGHALPALRPLDAAVAGMTAEVDELLAMLGLARRGPLQPRRATALARLRPGQQVLPSGSRMLLPLLAMLAGLGIDPWLYRRASGLPLLLEPRSLAPAGRDRYRRPLWLVAGAADAWLAMRAAAHDDGVVLEAISGFRSHAYQLGIFRRKLARGQTLDQILAVNAAPGFSEHHGGCALDIGTPGEPPAEESFEATAAFAWLVAHAARFGFVMSYPRDNPHGIVYEPWHWCWRQPTAAV